MATVAGIGLGFERREFAAGVAFRLSNSTIGRATVRPGEGQLVEIEPDAGVILVLLEDSADAVPAAHEAAQRALDLVAFTGRGAATLPRAHDEWVDWWRENDEITLRVIATEEVGAKMGRPTLEVRGPDGELKEPPPPPEPVWTPALRFFRQSQVADDVFEAYRNAFLALESILSVLVTGGPSGERAWLKHALGEVATRGLVQLDEYVTTPGTDPVEAFLREQYEALRHATFHAKAHRQVILPGSLAEREQVANALPLLTRLVIELSREVVKVGYQGGAITVAGFEGIYIAPKVGHLEMSLARHEDGSRVEQVGADQVGYLGKDDTGYEHAFGSSFPVAELAGREFDTLVAVAPGAGGLSTPLDLASPIMPVDAVGADRFEVILAFALHNLQQPRRRFVH